jgi:hypothetical protein
VAGRTVAAVAAATIRATLLVQTVGQALAGTILADPVGRTVSTGTATTIIPTLLTGTIRQARALEVIFACGIAGAETTVTAATVVSTFLGQARRNQVVERLAIGNVRSPVIVVIVIDTVHNPVLVIVGILLVNGTVAIIVLSVALLLEEGIGFGIIVITITCFSRRQEFLGSA